MPGEWGAVCCTYAGLSLPLAVLLLQAAFADLPPELEDAARLEGLNLWQRLRWVLLPLLTPAIASTASPVPYTHLTPPNTLPV